MKLIFASHNENKTAEIRQLLPAGIELLSLNDLNFQEEIKETSDTLEGNSVLKASYIYSIFKLPCFADDSGLEVDFLQTDTNRAPIININKDKNYIIVCKFIQSCNEDLKTKTTLLVVNR